MLGARIENITDEPYVVFTRYGDVPTCAVCLRTCRDNQQRACGYCRAVMHIRCTSHTTGRRITDDGRYWTGCWICKACLGTD